MNSNQRHKSEPLNLVYLIGTYPGLTTTFIDREIRALRQWGAKLQIMAIYRPESIKSLTQEQQDLQHGMIYLLPAKILTVLLAHIYFALLRPFVYARTLFFLVTRQHPSQKARVKTLVHFALGVYAAYCLRQQEFLEIHAHFVDRTATIALVMARLLDKPYSLSIHAGADVYVEPVLLREKIFEARHAVTCTRYNRTHIEALLGQDLTPKITHIRHGLELSRYRSVPSQATGKPLILSVGQLAERKGFAQLIQSCAKLKAHGYDFQCQIVGHGPQRSHLEELIEKYDLQSHVTLCGALPHDEVIEKFKQATIFALLCTVTKNGDVDGIPNVIAEAMAMDIPVVSTAVSAIPELLEDSVNGLLVPPNDIEAAVAALARLLDSQALRCELVNNGRETILSTFDVEKNVQRFATTLWPNWFVESSLH